METLADLAPTEADLRAAYRRLGPVERARMGWRAGRVRAGASVEEAGLIWWRARRDLAHQWWTVPLLAIVGLTGYLAIAETTGHREALVWLVPYLTGVPVMVFVNRPRLCRAMEANAARVNEVSGASLSTSSPRPTRSAYLVVVVALLLAVTVGDSLVQAATRALGARTTADVAELETRVDPEVALQPVQPPRALVDGAEPGAVPDTVVRHVDGPVVGARLADSLAFDLSECRLPRLFGAQDASPPYLVGPTSYVVLALGGPADPPDPPVQEIFLCEYDTAGELQPGTRRLRGLGSPGLGASGNEGIAGHRIVVADLAVPDEADWLLHGQGEWWLAVPVRRLLAVRVRASAADGDPIDSSYGQVVWVDAYGDVIEPP